MPAPEDGGTISDPELLMEIMDQREVIEETHDLVVLQAMLQENKLLQQATTEVRSKGSQDCTGQGLLCNKVQLCHCYKLPAPCYHSLGPHFTPQCA